MGPTLEEQGRRQGHRIGEAQIGPDGHVVEGMGTTGIIITWGGTTEGMELNYVEMITGYPIDWHPIVRADKKRGRGSSKHRPIEGPAGTLLPAANSVPGTQLDVSFWRVRCAPGPGDIGTSNSAGTRTDLQRPPLALHGTAGASALTEPPGYSETIGTALRMRGGRGEPASTAGRAGGRCS